MHSSFRWWASHAACGDLSIAALRERTQQYWQCGGALAERMAWYVEHLLPAELCYAEQRGALEFPACDTLAFPVGHSIEPLLQTISVFQPARVVLLLNHPSDFLPVASQRREGV